MVGPGLALLFGLIAVAGLITAKASARNKKQNPADSYAGDLVGPGNLAAGVGLAFVLLFGGLSSVMTIDAGEVGVEVLFGQVTATHHEGLVFKNPFSRVAVYPIRTVQFTYQGPDDENEDDTSIQAFSQENAKVEVDVTVLLHVDPTLAEHVYRTVGTAYETVLVDPFTRSVTRDCVAQFAFDVARTTARAQVADCVLVGMQAELGPRGLIVEAVELRGMRADAGLQAAIERKLEAANSVQEAEFRRQQAEVDRERALIEADARGQARLIEARAEAEANRLVAASLNADILALRIYEALAASSNNLIVLGGTGENLLLNIPAGG